VFSARHSAAAAQASPSVKTTREAALEKTRARSLDKRDEGGRGDREGGGWEDMAQKTRQ